MSKDVMEAAQAQFKAPIITSIYCIHPVGTNNDNTIHRVKHRAEFEVKTFGVKVTMFLHAASTATIDKKSVLLIPYGNIAYMVLEE